MSNLPTVQEIYAAFGQGDVPTILSKLAPDVDWEYGANPSDVPWLQRRAGVIGAGQFFASLAGVQIQKFVPKAFLEGVDVVVVLVDIDFVVTSTGKRVVEEDEAHIWYFNGAGQVTRFRHRVDTLEQANACRIG